MPFTIVHYFAYDGETGLQEDGVVDCLGGPRYFWLRRALPQQRVGLFDVAPVDPELMLWVRELGVCWHQWDVEYHAGRVELSTHPIRPGNNPRFAWLSAQIQQRADSLRYQSKVAVGLVSESAEWIERMRPFNGRRWPVPGTCSPVLEIVWLQTECDSST